MTDPTGPSTGAEAPGRVPRPADRRLFVVRFGLLVSWGLLLLYAGVALADGRLDAPAVWVPIALMAVALAGLTAVPWPALIGTATGDVLLLVWTAGLAAGMVSAIQIRPEPLPGAFAGIAVLAAATMTASRWVIASGVIAVAGYLWAVIDSPLRPSGAEVAVRLALLVGVVSLAVVLSVSLRRHLRETAGQIEELQVREAALRGREADLTELYAVARTLGAGTDIGEVLPELLARVAHSVDAAVGVVLFYDAEAQSLEVLSPIWVAGHSLRADEYHLLLTERGFAQRVFISSEGAAVNTPESFADDPLLADLSAQRAAAVPLRIDLTTIGVLLVTDKRDGDFTGEDIAQLQALATPAALVLDHLSRYEEAQEMSQRMAELAQLKTDFVSVVSHELRTPLTSIIGSLATLSRPQLAPTDPNAVQLLESARRQAERLKGLIEDLLVVSRLDQRAVPVRPEALQVEKFLREVVRSIPGTEGVVSVSAAPELPELEVDPSHLGRVITNLVENALKYASESDIEIEAKPSGNEVWIAVVDHGPGIPYELHDHIFQRFTQVDDHRTRARGGSGLGLSIVRGLTESMGGRVWYEPTLGGGATFTVAFPRTAKAYGMGENSPSA